MAGQDGLTALGWWVKAQSGAWCTNRPRPDGLGCTVVETRTTNAPQKTPKSNLTAVLRDREFQELYTPKGIRLNIYRSVTTLSFLCTLSLPHL